MDKPNLSFDCSEVARTLANYTIGFGAFTVKGRIEDAVPAGSGTLVAADRTTCRQQHELFAVPLFRQKGSRDD